MTIDPDRDNAALKRITQATLLFKEIYGAQGLRTFLLQELTREICLGEICLGEIAERNRALVIAAETRAAAEADAKRADLLQTAIEALAFYADSDNYDRRGAKPSPISADKGDFARNALEAIDAASAEAKPEGEAR